ncbi:MAG: hypothetical protein WBF33_01485 [Candidatus Nitrosopolaris sp.]
MPVIPSLIGGVVVVAGRSILLLKSVKKLRKVKTITKIQKTNINPCYDR